MSRSWGTTRSFTCICWICHIRDLTDLQFSYAPGILAIISMACTKFSVLQLQRRLCGVRPNSRYIKVMFQALAGTLVVWTLLSVLAIAFQCGVSSPYIYEADKCAGGSLWYPVIVGNAVTDCALAFSFSPIIMKLAARRQTKAKVMALLSTRLFWVQSSTHLIVV
jgi:hypothetical protein